MSTRHALLGLLLDRPSYQYELRDRLEQRLGPAWAVNSGQVSQDIRQLERDEMIERVPGAPQGGRGRQVYAITGKGVGEFEEWFDIPEPGVRLSRRPLLIKMTFAGPQRLTAALEQIDAYEVECAARLKELAQTRDAIPVDGGLVRADHLLLRLNISADIMQMEAELKWARYAREMVSWLSNRDAVWPSTRERADMGDRARERNEARRELFARMAASDRASKTKLADAADPD